MQARIIQVGGRNRAVSVALGVVALGVGALFMVFGLMLLTAVAAVGIVAGTGMVLMRALRGRRAPQPHVRELDGWPTPLDPRLEVRPPSTQAPPLPPAGDI